MALSFNSFLVSAVFGVFGFFLAFSLKRATNIGLFGVFIYVSLLALSYLGVQANWDQFHEVVNLLSKLGKALFDMVKEIIQAAAITSVLCFLSGGMLGFIVKK